MRFIREITITNRILLLLFVGLASLTARQEWAYQRWARRYVRASHCAPNLYPVYCIEANFLTDNDQPFAARLAGPEPGIDSTNSAATLDRGEWGSDDSDLSGNFSLVPRH